MLGAVFFMHAGIPRHLLAWVTEVSGEYICNSESSEPTIDRIMNDEFDSIAALKESVASRASAFLM